MFKRKSNLPPRPKHPSVSHIVEDLIAASGDSQFLEIARSINASVLETEEYEAKDAGYQNVKNFLQQNKELQKTMEELKGMFENLQACNTEISILSEDLKDQAIKALL